MLRAARPWPDADLGALAFRGSKPDQKLGVRRHARRIAAGGQRFDVSQKRPYHVDHPREADTGEVAPRKVDRAFVTEASQAAQLGFEQGFADPGDPRMESEWEVG